jgi:uncharacterized membrane protein YhaH (DUF805 family)
MPTSLAAPLYGATFPQAVSRFFRKYATFSGRASRSEYWWWVLANVLISLGLNLIGSLTNRGWESRPIDFVSPFAYGPVSPATNVAGAIFVVYALGTLLPALALTWRRLHDIDRSGAWFFIALGPRVGAVVLLVFTLMGPRPEGARFDEPYGRS